MTTLNDYFEFQLRFDIHESMKRKILSKFTASWRRWKREVALKYITPFEDTSKVLEKVPKKLQALVEQEDWDKYVKWRLSDECKVYIDLISECIRLNKLLFSFN